MQKFTTGTVHMSPCEGEGREKKQHLPLSSWKDLGQGGIQVNSELGIHSHQLLPLTNL